MEGKSKHEQILEITNEVVSLASKLGVIHANTEDTALDGRHIRINGKDLLFFGSCSYLGLEHDARLKAASIDAIQKYGTQFASSRAYVSSRYYTEAGDLLRQMFGQPLMIMPSLTLGHISNIPLLVGDRDAVILDSNVHDSVQNAVQLLKVRNIRVELIRHNNLAMLEDRIKLLKNNYQKIWYMADGVYSLHGDFAPAKELYKLADKYDQLRLYIDDIHGMSWIGKNGTGYFMSEVDYYHPSLYLTTGMTKAFGAGGGILVYPDEATVDLVRNTSRGFIFSVQMPPMVLAAIVASAKIHLTDEIYSMQNDLKKRVVYFNKKALELNLPLIHETLSPVTFIGVGKPETGFNMVRRLMNEGYFINICAYPSVSINNTGLRITLNPNLTNQDIDGLLNTLVAHLPAALKDTDVSMMDIYKSFKLVA